MKKAAEEGDLNTLKDILEPNPNFVNAKFVHDCDDYGYRVSWLYTIEWLLIYNVNSNVCS